MRRKVGKMKRKQKKTKSAAAAEKNVMVAARRQQKLLKVKAKAQTAAAPKQTRLHVRQKEKDITFIVMQENVRSLNSSERRFDELTQEVEGCRWELYSSVKRGEQAMPRIGRHNKDTYSWVLENSRTNTELGS